jgi:colanic acid/amylovoran biosynthesis protein
MPSGEPFKIATIGAALTANKGAASMLRAVIRTVPVHVGHASFAVLTTYPDEDQSKPQPQGVVLVSLRPRQLVFPVLPLCLVVWLMRRSGATGARAARLHPAVRALYEADLTVDLAGVSFVDGRGFPVLVYNLLMTGVAQLVGGPVVKVSQALGPFEEPLNRRAASFLLPRLAAVVARGSRTREHLAQLGLSNAHEAADIAFLLPVAQDDEQVAERLIDGLNLNGRYITLVPSEVVNAYCEERGIDYVSLIVDACERLVTEYQLRVVILAHSIRPGAPASRMNDLPLVEALGRRLSQHRDVHAVTEDLEPGALRAVIAGSDLCVTSRFHAMISALERSVPVLVVGWSHKYAEVLTDFELERWAMSYEELDADLLVSRVLELDNMKDDVRTTIMQHLPHVLNRSRRNLDIIAEVLHRGRS